MENTKTILIMMITLLSIGVIGIVFADVNITPSKVMEGQQITVHITDSKYDYAYVIFFENNSRVPDARILKLTDNGYGATAFDTRTMHKYQQSKVWQFGENHVRVIVYHDGIMQESIIPVLLLR